MDYKSFIERKSQFADGNGFDPGELPGFLFDFQAYLVDWNLRQGRSATFAECGLGKTPMQLVWAQKVVEHTNKPVLIVTPLAVTFQTEQEAAKFGIEAKRSRHGKIDSSSDIWITNYEQLHKFDPNSFSGMVADESSAIKNFKSERKAVVTEFMRSLPYRHLCTATAAPNDYWELGTSSEALGLLGFRDMITTFFRQEASKDYLGWGRTKYRFRGHAEEPFWSWVCSWARSIRRPSDLGYDDSKFILPPLNQTEHVVETAKKRDGMLLTMAARNLHEQRAERRLSIPERVAKAADIMISHDGPSVMWCELNDEADAMVREVPGAKQIKGGMKDEVKEELLIAFTNGELKDLVTKPKVGCWGLNWQHCNNVLTFPGHSFEQDYQLVRRCWRFGQTKPVNVHRIISEGESSVLKNLERKAKQVDNMFNMLVEHMNDAQALSSRDYFPESEQVPSWL